SAQSHEGLSWQRFYFHQCPMTTAIQEGDNTSEQTQCCTAEQRDRDTYRRRQRPNEKARDGRSSGKQQDVKANHTPAQRIGYAELEQRIVGRSEHDPEKSKRNE